MSESKEITTTYEINGVEINLTNSMVRKYLTRTTRSDIVASDQEIMMFLRLCKYQKLNPFLNEVYLVKMSNDFPATIITSKDVFIKRASKHPFYVGKKAGIVIQKENGETEKREGGIVKSKEIILGGWCDVYRKDYEHPITIEVGFDEYARRKKTGELMKNWANMPATMIRKVAVAQALREAFPEDFTGLYVEEEMDKTNSINAIKEEKSNIVESFLSPKNEGETIEGELEEGKEE